MSAIQYELNMENQSEIDVKFSNIQKQVDAACASMDKVRRKLFAENGEMKKLHQKLIIEIDDLREQLRRLQDENKKVEWVYGEGDSLFNVRESKQISC